MSPTTLSHPSPAPVAPTAPRPSPRQDLDRAVERLREAAPRFAKLTLDQRVALARSMQAGYLRVAEETVKAAARARDLRLGTPEEGEAWAMGPWAVVRHLRLIQQSLLAIKHTGNTPIGKVGRTIDGRVTAQVFPASAIDGVLFSGVRMDVHLQPGVTESDLDTTRASFYKAPSHQGCVALVLGAGNVDAIPSMDVNTKLFNEGKVCLLKMNPVNAYLGPYLEIAFADAINQGFLAVVYGGAEEGEYLVNHPGIDEVHLTGSNKTYERLMWGPPGPEQEARKASGQPLLRKPFTAELGNVSPVLIVPGPYSAKELQFQADDIAGAVIWNGSFNCATVRMVVTPRGWSHRGEFVRGLEQRLAGARVRKNYYPGTSDRWRALTQGRDHAKYFGASGADAIPWTLLADLDPKDREELAFSMEPFCPLTSETQVGSEDPVEFLDQAVRFANDRLWGTLTAGLVVHPESMKDPRIAEAVEQAITRLRYGVVAVNAWSGTVFGLGATPWGAHPSSTLVNIQSGSGWVHNSAMIEGIEKVVARHPLTVTPKPVYAPTHRSGHSLVRRLTHLEENSSWARVPGVLAAAVRA